MLPSGDLLNFGLKVTIIALTTFGKQFAFGLDWEGMFFRLFYGKLGVVRVLTSQWGFTKPSSIYISLGTVRDIVPLFIPLKDILIDFECF